jgi:hypothetical protein
MNPPINKKITGFAYGAAESSKDAIFNKGKSIMGNKATTGIGNASVTHQVIIKPATANALQAFGFTLKGFTRSKKSETIIPDRIARNLRREEDNFFKQIELRYKICNC